jgi:hypothetical protein
MKTSSNKMENYKNHTSKLIPRLASGTNTSAAFIFSRAVKVKTD